MGKTFCRILEQIPELEANYDDRQQSIALICARFFKVVLPAKLSYDVISLAGPAAGKLNRWAAEDNHESSEMGRNDSVID